MKKVLFFLSITLLVFACKSDDDLSAELSHDRGINDAPFLDSGEFIAAARFPASEMSSYQGKTLDAIEYYLVNTPNQCEVRVYEGSNGDEPGTLIYDAIVTTEMEANSWNVHTPPTAIPLTGDDLWIAVRIVLNSREKTIGCDTGPAVTNGDWFVSSEDNIWQTFRESSNDEVNINWNIRGDVSN